VLITATRDHVHYIIKFLYVVSRDHDYYFDMFPLLDLKSLSTICQWSQAASMPNVITVTRLDRVQNIVSEGSTPGPALFLL